jgi:CDP-glucose 4,6-dehydratase
MGQNGDMHYLITGHTGFKGTWLAAMLLEMGHEISGVALEPENGGIFSQSNFSNRLLNDIRQDIRDFDALDRIVKSIRPDVIVHLAAQPLVRRSYLDPVTTFETNVNGTLNLLRSISTSDSVKASLIITTDKVYRNTGQASGYRETDPLGGDDPYSASKSMADLLTQAWVKSFPGAPIAIARAGNVIGGGDVSEDRLLPDALRAFDSNKPLTLRYPDAVRPWQHVMDCLEGYILLIEKLLDGKGVSEWNFGPGIESFVSVKNVIDIAQAKWGNPSSVLISTAQDLHEANLLALDSTKAETHLNWRNKLNFSQAVEWTLDWEQATRSGQDAFQVTVDQIRKFKKLT